MKHAQAALLAALAASLFAGTASGYEPLQPIDRNPSFLEAKIKAVIHAIGDGINKGNFSGFREGYLVSSLVPQRISEQNLRDASRSLVESKVDLTRLDDAKPIMDGPPQEDADHQLLVSGHYATTPRLLFRMGFIREGSHLGLSKVELALAPPAGEDASARGQVPAPAPRSAGSPPAPTKPAETAGAMIDADAMAALLPGAPLPGGVALPADQRDALTAAMHAFALGVTSRDMGAFLRQDIVSPRWRRAQNGAQLAALYRTTLERGADFAKFDGAEVVIPHAPVLDGTGELDINGLIVAADRERIAFRAGFEREGGALKLINLLVARSRQAAR